MSLSAILNRFLIFGLFQFMFVSIKHKMSTLLSSAASRIILASVNKGSSVIPCMFWASIRQMLFLGIRGSPYGALGLGVRVMGCGMCWCLVAPPRIRCGCELD